MELKFSQARLLCFLTFPKNLRPIGSLYHHQVITANMTDRQHSLFLGSWRSQKYCILSDNIFSSWVYTNMLRENPFVYPHSSLMFSHAASLRPWLRLRLQGLVDIWHQCSLCSPSPGSGSGSVLGCSSGSGPGSASGQTTPGGGASQQRRQLWWTLKKLKYTIDMWKMLPLTFNEY